MKYRLSRPITIHELGQRVNQEDSLYPPEECLTDGHDFFILCDGMGGHESGEVASSTVCECMGGYLKEHLSAGEPFSNQMFENALAAAYDGLDSKDNPEEVKKMGTTMSFLMFHDSGVTAAHIGDSRIYQFRPGVDKPLFKSRDHSLVNDLILLGEITEEEARTSKNKNIITRAMQPGKENRAKADMTLLTDVQPGDWFYLCSDGMLEQMDDYVLGRLLTDTSVTDDQKRNELIQLTSSNRDNHTAFIIHVLDINEEPVTVQIYDSECDTDSDSVHEYNSIVKDDTEYVNEPTVKDEIPQNQPKRKWLKLVIVVLAVLIIIGISLFVSLIL